MRDAISQYLPWLMSLITIVAIELQGRKWPKAWAISLAGQLFWFTWIACSRQWGFLPMTSVLSIQYVRNHIKWKREAWIASPRPYDVPRLDRPCAGCKHLHACRSAGRCMGAHLAG